MKNEIRKNLIVGQFIFLLIVVGGSALIYWLFAPSYYSYQKSRLIKASYAYLQEMDFTMLDENDMAVFQQYESEDLLFTISDEKFRPVYVSWYESSERQVYKHIILCRDKFSENPEVVDRETKNPMAVKLMGVIDQDGSLFYVSIREKVFSINKFYGHMGKFLALIFVVALAVGLPVFYLLIRRITDRIGEIAEGAARVVVRDFSKPLKVDGPYQELNILAANINQMAAGMQDGVQEVLECAQERQPDLLDHIRRDVVADISHELKTPLAIISSQVEMLQCMGDQVDRMYYYDSIVEEVARMSDMVNNLMDLSLMEHQIQKMARQEMNLTDTMEYIHVKYQALFQQSHIKEEFSLEPECIVRGNAYYLEQAIDNYMMNAISHTVQGNCIQVAMRRQGGWVKVEVYNQGGQIDPALMERIWQGYVMKRSSRDETAVQNVEEAGNQRHMGIGLYLVRRIIQLHQGEYGVENQEKGVKFWFKIPEA